MRTRVRTLLARVGPNTWRDRARPAPAGAALLGDLWSSLEGGDAAVARAVSEIRAALGWGHGPDGFAAGRESRPCAEARRELARAVEAGLLVIEELGPPRQVPLLPEPPDAGPDQAPAPQEPALEPFHLILADRLSGAPLVGVALVVRTPSGDTLELTTDDGGGVRIAAVAPGTCEVTSVVAGARVRSAYAIRAGASGGAGAPGRRNARPTEEAPAAAEAPAPAHLVTAIPHRVATGETPDAIARMWGTTWSEIALFNWGTDDPLQLEEHYRDELGCTRRTADGRGYCFDGADDPGIVLVPHPWRGRLAVGVTHRLLAEPLRPLFITLQNEHGLPLPGARFDLRCADGSERSGRLGRSGIARLEGVPPGAFSVSYPDHDDVLARALAASVRRAFDDQSTGPLFHLLGQSRHIVERARAVYAQFFDDLTGKGLEADIAQVVTDPEARTPLLHFCALAGLRVGDGDQEGGR